MPGGSGGFDLARTTLWILPQAFAPLSHDVLRERGVRGARHTQGTHLQVQGSDDETELDALKSPAG